MIAANIIGVKILVVGPFTLPAGTIVFPVSYIVNDVLTEVYGLRSARRIIWLGFLANLLVMISIAVAQELPSPLWWDGQEAFERILGLAPRLLLASFAAYLIGSFSNAWVMAKMKAMTGERWLWTRTIGSTVVGEGLDSLLFVTIAFAGVLSPGELVRSILSVWVAKTLYEVIVTPLTYIVIDRVKKAERIDAHRGTRSYQEGPKNHGG